MRSGRPVAFGYDRLSTQKLSNCPSRHHETIVTYKCATVLSSLHCSQLHNEHFASIICVLSSARCFAFRSTINVALGFASGRGHCLDGRPSARVGSPYYQKERESCTVRLMLTWCPIKNCALTSRVSMELSSPKA